MFWDDVTGLHDLPLTPRRPISFYASVARCFNGAIAVANIQASTKTDERSNVDKFSVGEWIEPTQHKTWTQATGSISGSRFTDRSQPEQGRPTARFQRRELINIRSIDDVQ